MKKEQSGFGILYVVLVIVLIGLIGGTGWHIWKTNQENNQVLKNTESSSGSSVSLSSNDEQQDTGAANEPDPTEGWTTHSSAEGQYSLRYPAAWLRAQAEYCLPELTMIAPNEAALGKCASEYGGQVFISSSDGDTSAEAMYVEGQGWENIKQEAVTVAGVAGTKSTATATDQEGVGVVPSGTKATMYLFYTNNRTYRLSYVQRPTFQDVSKEFELIVTKTLQFKP